MTNKIINVVGAAIIDKGKLYTVQRNAHKSLPGMWEFPGGKIESGETKEEALIREVQEELTTDIEIIDFVNTAEYSYVFGHVILSVYLAKITNGQLTLSEHQAEKWLNADQLRTVEWAPVDYEAVSLLEKMDFNQI